MTSGRCVFCGAAIEIEGRVGRREECPSCARNLHACLQCRFFDRSAHNQCRENQASLVGDKEKANFCEFFAFGRDTEEERRDDAAAKAKLAALFKKSGEGA